MTNPPTDEPSLLAAELTRREDERREAEALAQDPRNLAEIAAVQADLDDLRAW